MSNKKYYCCCNSKIQNISVHNFDFALGFWGAIRYINAHVKRYKYRGNNDRFNRRRIH